jgi:hypothetical protein
MNRHGGQEPIQCTVSQAGSEINRALNDRFAI